MKKQKFSYAKHFGAALMLLLMLGSGDAFAQIEHKWLSIGDLESPYSGVGTTREQEPFDNAEYRFPAIDRDAGNNRSSAMRVGARNFTDENGQTCPALL